MRYAIYILVIISLMLTLPSKSFSVVIFEDDFSNDIGWHKTDGGTWACRNGCQPSKWTAYYGQPNTDVSITASDGEGGTPALKVGYQYGVAAPGQLGLAKHLTGNQSTGYNELYIRFKIKLDNNWRVGTGTSAQTFKMFRLWQYRTPTGTMDWSEVNGAKDTRFIIMNLNGSQGETYGVTCSTNVNDDSLGPQVRLDWYGDNGNIPTSTNGHFGSISEWNYNRSTGFLNCYPNCNQGWHYLEFHIKLSTIDAPGNGSFELWLDGVKQVSPTHINDSDPSHTWTSLPTKKYQGGINWFQMLDNIQGWTEAWQSFRYMYINNVVVSTSYIGPNYVISGGGPAHTTDTLPPAPPLID